MNKYLANSIPVLLLFFAIFGLVAIKGSNSVSDITTQMTGITSHIRSQIQLSEDSTSYPVKIVVNAAKAVGNALFDVILVIPEKSRGVVYGEDLLLSLELINFGDPGITDVTVNYLITDSKGNLMLIEHEKRVVETQTSFFKSIKLPELEPDQYRVYVELLYSNTSAIATEQFTILGKSPY